MNFRTVCVLLVLCSCCLAFGCGSGSQEAIVEDTLTNAPTPETDSGQMEAMQQSTAR